MHVFPSALPLLPQRFAPAALVVSWCAPSSRTGNSRLLSFRLSCSCYPPTPPGSVGRLVGVSVCPSVRLSGSLPRGPFHGPFQADSVAVTSVELGPDLGLLLPLFFQRGGCLRRVFAPGPCFGAQRWARVSVSRLPHWLLFSTDVSRSGKQMAVAWGTEIP